MSTKTIISIFALSLSLISCQEAANEGSTEELSSATTEQTQMLRQPVASSSADDGELSCLEQCGQEARNVIYANCLEEGEQQECATTGRQWYRDCLEDRCDESAIQLDDCRTECRINSKKEYGECIAETESAEECKTDRKMSVQVCIAECG